MRVKQYLRWELLLAMSLVGCTSVVPNRIGLPQPTAGDAEVQPAAAPAGLNLGTRLLFQVRWPAEPGYAAQAIPGATQKIEIQVVKGGQDKEVPANVVKAETMVRPTGTDTTTVTFNLDPALKTVDVYVRALSGTGTLLATGERTAVPVRDNTTTGVTVSLVLTEELAGQQAELDLRMTDHLRVLGALPTYFKNYDQLLRYHESQDVQDLQSSFQATFGEWIPKQTEFRPPNPNEGPVAYPSGDPKLTAYRVASRYTTQSTGEILMNPSNPAQRMEVLAGELQKLHWPGYVATVTYTEEALRHAFQVNVLPSGTGGGDNTRANLRAEVSAGSWVAEPGLTQSIDAWIDTGTATESVIRQVTFLGGKKPVESTINEAKLGFDITPKGITPNLFSLGLTVDTPREISNTPMYLAMTEKSPSSRQVTYAPKHARLVAQAPIGAATADVLVNDDFLGLKSRTDLLLRKNEGGFGAFLLELGGFMRLGPIGDHMEPVTGNLGFSLLDAAQKLRLEGTLQVQRTPFKATFIGRFVDVPSNTVVGTIDYDLPVDANGKVDMNHLAAWPILKLVDDQGTQFHLTPGFFSGETNGYIRVDVR